MVQFVPGTEARVVGSRPAEATGEDPASQNNSNSTEAPHLIALRRLRQKEDHKPGSGLQSETLSQPATVTCIIFRVSTFGSPGDAKTLPALA